ncbi:MAG: hypothetical protein A2015_09295 [Spirochaetes bacterium GWF1_31_7]|nr:MAG: hypothetical protein A2Y30_08925 [Spirochaetes bacterium GWE1_32_154]OHD45688.1 MAG: hypothetical protein A2Y29_10210 [Spirochaetes bacterium GWE2_31_10]OHD47682.1 MAG: hypothetical protein A2015_09295 [Spirochaetes bacterium GWF1_31_7]OHD83416.1 MAG: hypothetical protein A2355_11965 [Spirochaetes bacterium RIFOXYB1_FULL_32_8]
MKNSKKILYNCNIFNNTTFQKGYILILNDIIEDVIWTDQYDLSHYSDYEKINCDEGFVSYGFIDPHVHFRTPGNEDKEDWDSGSRAAVKGGFTYVIDMPNNKPSAVDYNTIREKNEIAKKLSLVNYGFHIGLTDQNVFTIKDIISQLRNDKINIHGIKVFMGSSTGNLLVTTKEIIRQALNTGEIVLFHAENEEDIIASDNFENIEKHEQNRPAIAEKNAISKIMESISSKQLSKVYICHLSSNIGLQTALQLRKSGITTYLEITPHHLYFSINDTDGSAFFKINPPIRNFNDVSALRDAFNSGVLDLIGTDHAPHLLVEKQQKNAPSGFPGLETAFYALYELSKRDVLSFDMIFKMLTNAYSIFNIKNRGEIKKGNFADLTIIKKNDYIFKSENSYTKAKFSPFENIKSDLIIDTVIISGKEMLINNKF